MLIHAFLLSTLQIPFDGSPIWPGFPWTEQENPSEPCHYDPDQSLHM